MHARESKENAMLDDIRKTGDFANESSSIPVLLTFDDGPHAGAASANLTRKIAAVLKTNSIQNGILGVFFVQTHAKGEDGSEIRFGNPNGSAASKAAFDVGHLIEIHTGSDGDHVKHTVRVAQPAYNVGGSSAPDGQNALESDLIRAKARIKDKVGREPKYVRAVGLERNAAVDATYARVGLKHIGVNVDSKDGGSAAGSEPSQVKQTLKSGPHSVPHAIASGAAHLIVLFHDTNSETAANLADYIKVIADAALAAGKTAKFVTSRDAALQILNTTSV
jgi:peptidoglycan/xylan/chitin deacetylase (PgdA/CDA1 family)